MDALHLTDDNLLFAGDWHGMLNQGKAAFNRARDKNINSIIQLGDFGYWGDERSEKVLDTWDFTLKRWGGQRLFFVDGNHENFPALYKNYKVDETTGMRQVRDNIFHLPRGYVFTWNDYRMLAFGGAYSIDRGMRKKNVSYWHEEVITGEDIQTALINLDGKKADIMIAHDSPSVVPNHITDNPRLQHTAGVAFGFNRLHAATEHRKMLDEVYHAAEPALVAHGHYHAYFVEPALYGAVACLDEGSKPLSKSTLIVDPELVEEARSMRRLPI